VYPVLRDHCLLQQRAVCQYLSALSSLRSGDRAVRPHLHRLRALRERSMPADLLAVPDLRRQLNRRGDVSAEVRPAQVRAL
jgi:hypothetical protein